MIEYVRLIAWDFEKRGRGREDYKLSVARIIVRLLLLGVLSEVEPVSY
jgi:hypothetical protein